MWHLPLLELSSVNFADVFCSPLSTSSAHVAGSHIVSVVSLELIPFGVDSSRTVSDSWCKRVSCEDTLVKLGPVYFRKPAFDHVFDTFVYVITPTVGVRWANARRDL